MERTGQNAGTVQDQLAEREKDWEQRTQGGESGSTFRQIRSAVADKLQAAAQTLHQKAARSGQQDDPSHLGHRAADWLERSAGYVNEMEPERLKSDIENQVRRNPGRSLLIAGAVGLVLGSLLRRR
ncbi:MAG: hypothetical protein L0312_28545 [Acidobacteria bacterium]|nr:hypothetical protein [Acidobacteriota bacterium]